MSDAAAFMELARRIARGLASIEKQQVCCGTITLQQFDTLRALKETAGLTTSAIAGRLGIDLSTASRNLTVLERQGYISRVRAAEDSRQIENRLTPAGRRCVESLCCDEEAVFAAILARIPPAQRGRVLEALGLLDEALCAAPAVACCPVTPKERK